MNFSQIKKTIVIVLFLCAVCFSLLTPVRDPDFFWHLATGKWIAEHRELPKADPFAFTTSLKTGEDFIRARIILTQYWLANLLQYGVYSLAGFYGIIALRAFIVLLTLLALALHMRKKGLGIMPVLFLFLPVCYVLFIFMGDRPNQMTFLFAAAFMFLLDALKRGEAKGYFLPVLFVIWANIHGGFLLGAVVVIVTCASELLKKMFLRRYSVSRKFLSVLLLTLGAGCLNPNGYDVIYTTFSWMSTYYIASIVETMSPLSYVRQGSYAYMLMLAISLLFSAWYFLYRIFSASFPLKESLLTVSDELLYLLVLAFISFTSIRYIPLFVVVLTPVVAPLFSGKFQGLLQNLSRYLVPECLLAAVSLLLVYDTYSSTVLKLPAVDPNFPDDAVQFMKDKNMQGHIFNYYDWGGYLIWQFYPERAVFIDGRGLVLRVYDEFNDIISGRQERRTGEKLYEAPLDAYSVRHIVVPAVNTFGGIIKILKPLENDPQWHLVFCGRSSLVFTQDPAEQEYPKSLSYVAALSGAMDALNRVPDSPVPYITYAKANSYLGRRQTAIEGLEGALRSRPHLRGGAVERTLGLLKEGREIPIDYE